jgi:hypothetical protein
MAPSSWPNELRKALARRRLPGDYSQRLMDELEHAAAEFRRRTFVGRHPIITFIVAPIPVVVASIIAVVLSLMTIGWLIPEDMLHGPSGIAISSVALSVIAWTVRVLPFAACAVVFARAASRSGCDWRWGTAAAVLVAAFAGTFNVWYHVPTAMADSGQFGIGFGLPPGPVQLAQCGLPLVVALWHAWRGSLGTRLLTT